MALLDTKVTGIDAVVNRVERAASSVDEATTAGLINAGEQATEAMEHRIMTAITNTGAARADLGGEPGRIRTGKMIRSLRENDGTPGKMGYSPGGDLDYEVGYVNNPPGYTFKQENTPYSQSGVLDALQQAQMEMADVTEEYVQEAIDDMVHQTETSDYTARIREFAIPDVRTV